MSDKSRAALGFFDKKKTSPFEELKESHLRAPLLKFFFKKKRLLNFKNRLLVSGM